VIEGTLARLLEQNLEDTTFQALQASLQPAPAGTGAGGLTLLPSAAASTLANGVFSGGSARGGGNDAAAAAAAMAGIADARAKAAEEERCSLLNILLLIYYHPRKQCTPDRFLSLAGLFHTRLFTRALPRSAAGGSGEPSPAQMSIKLVRGDAPPLLQLLPAVAATSIGCRVCCYHCCQAPTRRCPINAPCCISRLLPSPPLPHGLPQATLLLLEMLDVDKVLAALASGQLIDEAAYAFAAPGVKQRVNAELASWWPAASAAHSPVLLAWAAVLCLIGKSGGAGGSMAGHSAGSSRCSLLHLAALAPASG
jgi:hypothetical protein